MPAGHRIRPIQHARLRRLFLLVVWGLVHWHSVGFATAIAAGPGGGGQAGAVAPKTGGKLRILPRDAALPVPVDEMREAMLAAVRSGDIEDLRHAFELNEMKPDLGAGFGPGGVADPVAFWRQHSDGTDGRQILAVLAQMFDLGAAAVPLGRDVENNLVYVWPYLAEIPPRELTPAQQVDLLRLVGPEEARRMRERNAWTWWRLVIGADGTWHALARER